MTQKHLKKTNQIIEEVEVEEEEKEDYYCVHCGKEYKCRSGLWKHIQKTHKEDNEDYEDYEDDEDDDEHEHEHENEANQHDKSYEEKSKTPMQNIITPELLMMLIQQNKDMQRLMMEQNKDQINIMMEFFKNAGNHNSNNNNTINNIQNNKSFNLNVFLNETCKDAMNMSDFLNMLDVTTYDFEQTGKNGYVEGMCRILENGLNKLEVHERPIHCTDAKRETIYIKDNDKWEKDDDKKTKLVSVIKQVGSKNIKMISQWCKEHPGWKDPDSKENDRYLKYVSNAMCGGTDDEIHKNYGDIARYISKITVVDKKEVIAL
jgi:hypothetical protein